MKKIVMIFCSLVLIAGLCSCGSKGTQTVSFHGISMEIPANWKLNENTKGDDYVEYEKTNLEGHDFHLIVMATKAYIQIDEDYTVKKAGENLTNFTEDDITYSDVSKAESGKFAGKYDMNTVTCTATLKDLMGDINVYYAKICEVYMGEYNIKFTLRAAEDDFSAFDQAIENATVE